MYGLGISEVWGDSLGGTQSSGVRRSFMLSPDLGLAGYAGRNQYVVQYAGTMTRYSTATESPVQSFHTGTIGLAGDLTPRWSWDASLAGSYGHGILQQVSSLRSDLSSNLPVVDAGGNVLFESGRIVGEKAAANLSYRQSPLQTITFSMVHGYYALQDEGLHMNEANFRLSVNRALSRKWDLQYYAQAIQPLEQLHCSSIGGAAGFHYKPSDATAVQMSVGPQISPAGCGRPQGFNFDAGYLRRFGRASHLYFTAHRQFTGTELSPSLWEDAASAGLIHPFTRRTSISLDSGYARGDQIANRGGYHGYFASGRVEQRLNSFSVLSATYRHFYNAAGLESLGRNLVFVSLEIRPAPLRLAQ